MDNGIWSREEEREIDSSPQQSSLFDLRGKVALITGASRGIGRAAAVVLAGAGAHVVLVGRDQGALKVSAQEAEGAASGQNGSPNIHCLTADLSDPESVKRVFSETEETFGGLNILVNNAGVGVGKRFLDTKLEDWDQIHAINLRGAFLCAREAVEIMRKGGGGKIINMASASALVGMPGLSAYGAAKGGLVALTRSMAVELAREDIFVNAVLPGYITTDMSREFLESETGKKFVLENVPLQKPGTPSDVAAAILFLAAPASDYVTGVVLPVDGGQTAK